MRKPTATQVLWVFCCLRTVVLFLNHTTTKRKPTALAKPQCEVLPLQHVKQRTRTLVNRANFAGLRGKLLLQSNAKCEANRRWAVRDCLKIVPSAEVVLYLYQDLSRFVHSGLADNDIYRINDSHRFIAQAETVAEAVLMLMMFARET